MGSLMGGWKSPVQDPKTVKLQRNRSLTKEGIENYWRSKKKNEEEQMSACPKLSHQHQEKSEEKCEKRYERSSSMPLPSSNTKENSSEETREEKMEKLLKKNGWWISSNWAFLNEPPVILTEAPTYKYASQYHVASRRTSNSNLESTSI